MPHRWVDSDPLRDMLVEMGRLPAPQRRFSLHDVAVGWLVFDNERELVGRVASHLDPYLVIQRFFHGYHVPWWRAYIPASAIGEVHQGAVLLNVPRDWIGRLGWGRPPRKPPARWQHS